MKLRSPLLIVLMGITIIVFLQGLTLAANQTSLMQNLALHKTAFASGNEVAWLGPQSAVDADTTSRWSSPYDDAQWWYVDLGSVQVIDRVVIKWQTPAATYQVLGSVDAVNWVNLMGSELTVQCAGGIETLDFPRVSVRYVKFQGVERARASDGRLYGYSFYEFEVYAKNELISTLDHLQQLFAPITKGQSRIQLPEVPAGYRINLEGSDAQPVINIAGDIHTPLVDVTVTLLLQIEDVQNPDIKPILKNVTVMVPGEYVQTDELNAVPSVIPSLSEWHGATGHFTLTQASRIVVNPHAENALKGAAQATQSDLRDLTNFNLEVVYGQPVKGDLYLTLDSTLGYLGEEGYLLDIDDYVSIQAANVRGAFYGTRTVLQILKQNLGRNTLPKGAARDYPKYAIRGLMLDVARKFYTIDFLCDYVKLLSWYKMNTFQIHLNDDVSVPFADGTRAAFRLESTTYPGLTSRSGFYTKDEFRALQQLGMNYGVNVIPEIDTPGHSRAFTQYNPLLGNDRNLDVTRPQTVEFVKNLWAEYLDGDNPTFIGPDVHIGTDEFSGENHEVFRGYMNTLIEFINSKGKHPHLWGGLTKYAGRTPVSTAATMDIWHEPYGSAQQAIDLGYNIINVSNALLYIVPRNYKDQLNTKSLYETWEPNNWVGTVLPMAHPHVKGGMFALWNDVSEAKGFSMDDSHNSMLPAIQVLAEKMWTGTRENNQYTTFVKLASVIADAPQANLSHRVTVPNPEGLVLKYTFDSGFADDSGNTFDAEAFQAALTIGKTGQGLKLTGGESYLQTPLDSLGFGWTLSMWVKPDVDNPTDAILLESPAGQLKLKQGNTGKLGFTKEHYHSHFNYEVPANVWTHLWLTGDSQGVSLFVNGGEYIERLTPEDAISPMQTFVLPLARIGSTTRSFNGVIDDLLVYNRVIEPVKDPNLAIHKAVTASSVEDPKFPVEYAVDKDTRTRWSSARTNDTWFLVDLGEVSSINKVVIKWETAYAKRYSILVSNDQENWVNVSGGTGIVMGNGGTETIEFAPVSARYVKFQGIERATKYGYSFYEFEVYGVE